MRVVQQSHLLRRGLSLLIMATLALQFACGGGGGSAPPPPPPPATGGGTTAPAAPSGLTATALTSVSLALTWTDNATNETGFKIERGTSATGPFTQIGTTPTNFVTYTDTGLTVATAYSYRVRATNAVGDSAYTAVATATTPTVMTIPTAPSNLAVAAGSAGSLALTWTDNSSNESGFKVERGTSVSGPFTQIATTATNVATYTDTGLAASTAYFYQVRATNSAGDSAYTAVASATTISVVALPAAPSNLAASAASATSVSLLWTDNSTNETGFKVERSSSATGPFSQIAITTANVASYNDTGLSASTTYYYQVRATNSAGDSAYTAVASATTPASVTVPAAPTGLVATATATTSIGLTWTDNSNNETGFKIERSTSATGTFSLIATNSANITNYSDTGLSAGTAYYYRVRSTNSAGDSANTAVATATTPAAVTIPAAPSGLIAAAISTSGISLSWTDNSNNETGFKIERSTSSGGTYTLIGTNAANATTFSDSGLASSTAYYYRVRSTNSAGDSANTAVATATTQTPAPTSTTVTLYPVADNLIMVSSWDSAIANRVYASGELAVGTGWNAYYDINGTFIQTYLRAESLVKYDVLALAGKTIESATLTVNRQYFGVNQHNWWIVALASPWSTNTVTWNTVNTSTFLHYTGNQLYLNPPTAVTTAYDITPMVRNWASGFWSNQGLWFTPDVSLMPGGTQYQAFAFYSLESGSSYTWAPSLTVTYR